MPIEFRCAQCEKLLRISDPTAGKHARCPSCGNIQPVPSQAGAPAGPGSTPGPAPAPSVPTSQPSTSPAGAQGWGGTSSPAPSPASVPSATPNAAAPPAMGAGSAPSAPSHVYNPATGPGSAAMTAPAPRKVQGPAIALIVLSILGFGTHALVLLTGIVAIASGEDPDETVPLILFGLFNLPLFAFMLFGGIQLRRLKTRGVCMAAAITALLPCGCCVWLGIPFGIWALVVMSDPAVKNSFH